MAGLLEHDKTDAPDPSAGAPAIPDAPVVEPAAPALEPATRACATCAAPLADRQDWCLECGSAQPGRLGSRPGWRAALTVVAACVLLATGAAAAAYAALSSESQRVASAPPPPAAAPVVSEPPAVPAPADETPTVDAPDSEPADLPEIKAPADDPVDTPAPTPAPDTSADAGSDDDAGDGAAGEDDAADAPASLDLSAGAASTYDPYDRAGNDVGDPADALDGKAGTAWQAPVNEDGEVRIGLAVTLEEATALSKVAFEADTPGFTVEIYGSTAKQLPPDILDARWENLGTKTDVGISEQLKVKGKFRHVVLWFTAQPADTIVAVPEIQLFD